MVEKSVEKTEKPSDFSEGSSSLTAVRNGSPNSGQLPFSWEANAPSLVLTVVTNENHRAICSTIGSPFTRLNSPCNKGVRGFIDRWTYGFYQNLAHKLRLVQNSVVDSGDFVLGVSVQDAILTA